MGDNLYAQPAIHCHMHKLNSSNCYFESDFLQTESYLNERVLGVNFPQHEITRKINAVISAIQQVTTPC